MLRGIGMRSLRPSKTSAVAQVLRLLKRTECNSGRYAGPVRDANAPTWSDMRRGRDSATPAATPRTPTDHHTPHSVAGSGGHGPQPSNCLSGPTWMPPPRPAYSDCHAPPTAARTKIANGSTRAALALASVKQAQVWTVV